MGWVAQYSPANCHSVYTVMLSLSPNGNKYRTNAIKDRISVTDRYIQIHLADARKIESGTGLVTVWLETVYCYANRMLMCWCCWHIAIFSDYYIYLFLKPLQTKNSSIWVDTRSRPVLASLLRLHHHWPFFTGSPIMIHRMTSIFRQQQCQIFYFLHSPSSVSFIFLLFRKA